ncbi:CheR family methyltransferase [Segnochrobactraceae bacterium EtOH-i3]
MSVRAASVLTDPDYGRLKERIIGLTGLSYFLDKDDALAERLERRLSARGIGCGSYLAILDAERFQGAEMDALVEQLTIGETFFFRFREQFTALVNTVLPERIARNAATRRLRIWSAACSNGAETYSLAAVVRDVLGPARADWQVTIVGTDINRAFLSQARRGHFTDWALRDLSASERATVVTPAERNVWHIRDDLAAMVEFRHNNLMTLEPHPAPDAFLTGFDIILCRNVMIYFDVATLTVLLPRLSERLAEGGWLLVGHAETGELFDRVFDAVPVPGATLYRKRDPARAREVPRAETPLSPLSRLRTAPVAATPAFRPVTPRPRPARLAPVTARPPAVPGRMGPDDGADDTLRALVDRGDWAGAETAARARIAAAPTAPDGHYFLALVHDHRDEADEADRCLRRALYLDRSFAMAHVQLGALMRRRGDIEAARRAFLNGLKAVAELADDAVVPASGLDAAGLRTLITRSLGASR